MKSITPSKPPIATPPVRLLRGYAFDPSLSTAPDTAGINQTKFAVRWETLARGPVGEYVEAVDHDPASGRFYEPVDLEHPHVLAQDGLPTSATACCAGTWRNKCGRRARKTRTR